MRNILEYPITSDEAITELNTIITETLNDYDRRERIGDMRALILQWVVDRIQKTNTLPWLPEGWDSHCFNSGGFGSKSD